ncbi:hypothetical protein KKA23_00370 [Patescibacteria group bacterium]|nr:hypothetical protein [Patescibacteria group bacterium]
MQNKKLANLIIKMANEDQKIRFDALKAKNNKKAGLKILKIDKKNTTKAKEIIKRYNWPTFDFIGKRASKSFWLIIQHADLDVKFQDKCLKLLKKAVKKKQAFPKTEAYLTDRVLVNLGKKQKFGTQFIRKNNKLIPRAIIDKKNVNKRRKAYDLDTLEENIKQMQK